MPQDDKITRSIRFTPELYKVLEERAEKAGHKSIQQQVIYELEHQNHCGIKLLNHLIHKLKLLSERISSSRRLVIF